MDLLFVGNRVFLQLLIILSLAEITACGSHGSTEDTVKRDREREQSKSESIFTEYNLVTGSYRGSNEMGDFVLQLKPAWNPDGSENHVPSPIIIGSLSFYPNVVMEGSEPVQMAYPINNGNYISSSKDLTLNVDNGSSSSLMSCHSKSAEELNCDWFSSRGKLNLQFKQQVQEKSLTPLRSQGFYTGETEDYHIESTFRSYYASSTGSQISKVQISAEFAFISKKSQALKGMKTVFKSNDGNLDPFSNVLTFNIPGDNQITVNCKLLTKDNLSCQWISIHTLGFELHQSK